MQSILKELRFMLEQPASVGDGNINVLCVHVVGRLLLCLLIRFSHVTSGVILFRQNPNKYINGKLHSLCTWRLIIHIVLI